VSGFSVLFRSSIGRKFVVAVTGLVMLGFLIAHMVGNLKAFAGAPALNHYAELLRIEPELLLVTRTGLLVAVVLHVFFVVQLALENRRARPSRYAVMDTVKATLASRTMLVGGILIFGYVVYHLMHLTFRSVHRDLVPFDHTNVFGNVAASFKNPAITATYVALQVVLLFHLQHGIQSALRTIGVSHPRYVAIGRSAGWVLAVVITVGFAAVPLGVFFGVIQ
jgi:succinate dehydrogenase / fumarate reductase cytochrome b subunit